MVFVLLHTSRGAPFFVSPHAIKATGLVYMDGGRTLGTAIYIGEDCPNVTETPEEVMALKRAAYDGAWEDGDVLAITLKDGKIVSVPMPEGLGPC